MINILPDLESNPELAYISQCTTRNHPLFLLSKQIRDTLQEKFQLTEFNYRTINKRSTKITLLIKAVDCAKLSFQALASVVI